MEEIEEAAPVEEAETPADVQATGQQNGIGIWRTIGIIAAVLLIVFVIGAILFGLVSHPFLTSMLRDISIIVLALVTMITSIFLAILLFQLQSLIALLRDEVQPILESMNETAGTVRGTTTFVSDAVVSPMIQVASYASAVRMTFKTLFGGSGRKGASRSEPKQQ